MSVNNLRFEIIVRADVTITDKRSEECLEIAGALVGL